MTTADKRAEQSGLDQIAGLLFGVAERTRRAFEAAAASFDLTPAQARALLTLEQPAPMRSLADLLHCDASNVTGIADRLEGRGLVVREAAEGDRRVKLLALTPAGLRLRARLEAAIADASPIMTDLDAGERETLVALLTNEERFAQFDGWLWRACAHEEMEVAHVSVSNWSGYRATSSSATSPPMTASSSTTAAPASTSASTSGGCSS